MVMSPLFRYIPRVRGAVRPRAGWSTFDQDGTVASLVETVTGQLGAGGLFGRKR